jgi:hypothetical protein
VSNILAKLGVASRVEAAAVAHRLGLLGERAGALTPRPPAPLAYAAPSTRVGAGR